MGRHPTDTIMIGNAQEICQACSRGDTKFIGKDGSNDLDRSECFEQMKFPACRERYNFVPHRNRDDRSCGRTVHEARQAAKPPKYAPVIKPLLRKVSNSAERLSPRLPPSALGGPREFYTKGGLNNSVTPYGVFERPTRHRKHDCALIFVYFRLLKQETKGVDASCITPFTL